MKHAIINKDGIVVNVIVWDMKTQWSPPRDHFAVQLDIAEIGDLYDFDTKQLIKNNIL